YTTLFRSNADVDDMKLVAQKIQEKNLYRRVCVLEFDWRQAGALVATDLGQRLDKLHSEGFHSIDIIAHSRGVLISRYALETLGKTAAIRSLYALCGPNEGANFASLVDLLRALRLEYINLTRSDLPFGIADYDSPALHEMIDGSEFLTQLNNDQRNFQRGYVHYYLLSAGLRDQWVSPNSALAKNICMYALTAGTVESFEYGLTYTHTGLIQTPSGVAELLKVIMKNKESNLTIASDSQYFDAQPDGWIWSATITNNEDHDITINDVAIDQYDKDGIWYSVQWYNSYGTPGDVLPHVYTTWDRRIAPSESVKISVHTRPDYEGHTMDQVIERLKARTRHVIVRYQIGDLQKSAGCFVRLRYGNVTPDNPLQRSRQIITAEN
ncbi:MAG: hypothetical protein M1338_03090, partial [Patescibacteria group bacterium]|nr:hypothetical protein [Patescibacteria group bacterium]